MMTMHDLELTSGGQPYKVDKPVKQQDLWLCWSALSVYMHFAYLATQRGEIHSKSYFQTVQG